LFDAIFEYQLIEVDDNRLNGYIFSISLIKFNEADNYSNDTDDDKLLFHYFIMKYQTQQTISQTLIIEGTIHLSSCFICNSSY
jgi:hypothetical protein